MRYRTLGKTSLTVSEVGFGTWGIGGNAYGDSYGNTDDAVSLAALHRAYELGCTFFDTSNRYGRGHSETLLGQALRGWNRDEVIIATHGGTEFLASASGAKPNFSAKHLTESVEHSLKRLNIEAIDIYHLQTPPLELVQHGQVFDVLKALKQTGKIRFYGISIHDPQEGIQAIQRGQVDTVQAIYNLFDTRLEKQLIEACQQTGTGLIAREPLARGFLSGTFEEGKKTFERGDARAIWPPILVNKRIQAAKRFQEVLEQPTPIEGAKAMRLAHLALAYPLACPTISSVVVGCKTPEQVTQNFEVVQHPPLTPEMLLAIRAIQDTL